MSRRAEIDTGVDNTAALLRPDMSGPAPTAPPGTGQTTSRVSPRYVAVCAIDDIPSQGARVLERPGHRDGNVALFRTGDDRVFAVLDRCPHRGGPLSQGLVYGHRVACPLHNWSVELGSGEAVAPDVGCTRSFPVKVITGRVYVALD